MHSAAHIKCTFLPILPNSEPPARQTGPGQPGPRQPQPCQPGQPGPRQPQPGPRQPQPGQPGPRQPQPCQPGQPRPCQPRPCQPRPCQPQPPEPQQPGPSQPRELRHRRVPLVATANPMAKDFSAPHGGVYGVHFTKRWMEKFEVVRKRPEFRPIAVHTLAKARNGKMQILSVQFGNSILEGTWPRIMEVLFIKMIQATENSFEEDAAAQMAASNGPTAA